MDRVISRAPGLKLVVETLITSLRPIGNIVLICCAFFIIFGILGVQVKTCGNVHSTNEKIHSDEIIKIQILVTFILLFSFLRASFTIVKA